MIERCGGCLSKLNDSLWFMLCVVLKILVVHNVTINIEVLGTTMRQPTLHKMLGTNNEMAHIKKNIYDEERFLIEV
jgi:hypothetical protein